MEPEKTPPGSPVATADVDDVAAKLKAKAHVSPAGEKPKRHLESPDKAPRNRANAQKTTANDDGKIFKSPMKNAPSAGDEDCAAAATPAELTAKDDGDDTFGGAPPLPPQLRSMADDMADDEEEKAGEPESMMSLDLRGVGSEPAGPTSRTQRVDGGMHPVAVARRLQVEAMDIDEPRVRFGVPVTCPVVAMAPQIAIRTWRVPPQPDPVLLLTSSTTLQTDTFRVLHEWAYQDDQALATILRVLRLVPSRTTTRDYALLARDEPEGRALLELVSHDSALLLCRQFAEDARATPVVLSDLRWGTPVEIHPMSHAIACWKADAHDERLHELLEAASYCERVEAGTETLDWRREKRLEALARASPLWSPEDRTTFNGIRKTSQQSAALQKVLYLGRRLRSYAADDRAAERLVENRERYLRERDASRQVARGLLSRAGRLEALYLETNSMLRELDTLTWLRLGPLFNEARTLDVVFTQPRGTPRERAKAFLVVLAGALDESPAQEQVKARAEAYENKWKPTENSDLVVAAHEATLTTFEHDDLFAFDPLRWNDADVDASRAALREHDVQPRGRWATHRGMIQPGLIAEDPPETLRDGPAFHASHYRPETAEDIARDLRRGGV